MSISLFHRQIRFSWLALSLYLLLMTLLCSLGFWQLDRSVQKKQILSQQQGAIAAGVVELSEQVVADIDSNRYRRVTIKGQYDQQHQFLIDNQIKDGKSGYFVLTPFLIDKGNLAVLVNRGWIAMGKDRNNLPDVAMRLPVEKITGRINHFPAVGIKLKGAEVPTDTWPSVVQVVDSRVLSNRLGYQLHDFQIELDNDALEGYRREWKIGTAIPPEKHLAYAVQWFGLALTLTGLFIWISLKKTQ